MSIEFVIDPAREEAERKAERIVPVTSRPASSGGRRSGGNFPGVTLGVVSGAAHVASNAAGDFIASGPATSSGQGNVPFAFETGSAPLRFLFAANTSPDPHLEVAGCDVATIEALRGLGHEVDEIWCTDMPRKIAHRNLHQLLELPANFARVVGDRCAKRNYDVVQVNQPHAYLAAKQHRLQERVGIFVNRSHGWEPCARHALAGVQGEGRSAMRRGMSRVMAHLIERHNRSIVRWSDGIVLCSQSDREYIIKRHRGSAERLLALAPGSPPEFLAPLPAETPNRWKSLLFVGEFAPYKGPKIVAQVFRDVLRSVPDCRATWICPQQFHEQARQLIGRVAAGSVTLLDWMPRSQLRTLYDQHGLILIPSHFEGFSLTLLEAMARGMCILGTEVGGHPQVIRQGTNGFLFRPGSADELTQCTLQLLSQPDDCRRISAAARQKALEFTWQRSAHEYVDFCRKLIHFKQLAELARH